MKRYLDDQKNYIPVYDTDPESPNFGKEIPSQMAYQMGPITAVECADGSVRVDRDDVDEPIYYTPSTDGFAYWLAQAKAQA
jgi:hypothetical protein